jgi:uncharacterized protein YycO
LGISNSQGNASNTFEQQDCSPKFEISEICNLSNKLCLEAFENASILRNQDQSRRASDLLVILYFAECTAMNNNSTGEHVHLDHVQYLDLNTGDLILFSRPCLAMSPLGAAICACAKMVSQSHWDHVGVVIRAPDGQLLLLEAAFSGIHAYPLQERLRKSKSYHVAVRKLVVPSGKTQQELDKIALQFASDISGRPYESSFFTLVNTVLNPLAKSQRHRVHRLLQESKERIEQVRIELKQRQLTPFQKEALKNEQQRLEKQIRVLTRKLDNLRRPILESSEDLSELFCSELVAALYQKMGVLAHFPPPNEYMPVHFSKEHSRYLPFTSGATLGPEIMVSLKKKPSSSAPVTAETKKEQVPPSKSGAEVPVDLLNNALHRSRLNDFASFENQDQLVPKDSHHSVRLKSFELYPGESLSLKPQNAQTSRLIVVEDGHCELYCDDRAAVEGSSSGVLSILGPKSFVESNQDQSRNSVFLKVKQKTKLWEISISQEINEAVKKSTSSVAKPQLTSQSRTFLTNLLKHHPLFQSFFQGPEAAQRSAALLDCFFPIKFKAGETIIHEGEPADNFYIIEKGSCEITKMVDSDVKRLQVIYPGAQFGEVSLLYGTLRGASVSARDDVDTLAIDLLSFIKLTRSGSKFMSQIFEKFASEHPTTHQKYIPKDVFVKLLLKNADPEYRDDPRMLKLVDLLIPSDTISFPEFVCD